MAKTKKKLAAKKAKKRAKKQAKTIAKQRKQDEKLHQKMLLQPARAIGPEDVRPGMFVTPARVTCDAFWIGACGTTGGETIKQDTYQTNSWRTGEPLKVIAVSLPYVYVQDAEGDFDVIDVTRNRLARVSDLYGETIAKAVKHKKKSK